MKVPKLTVDYKNPNTPRIWAPRAENRIVDTPHKHNVVSVLGSSVGPKFEVIHGLR